MFPYTIIYKNLRSWLVAFVYRLFHNCDVQEHNRNASSLYSIFDGCVQNDWMYISDLNRKYNVGEYIIYKLCIENKVLACALVSCMAMMVFVAFENA